MTERGRRTSRRWSDRDDQRDKRARHSHGRYPHWHDRGHARLHVRDRAQSPFVRLSKLGGVWKAQKGSPMPQKNNWLSLFGAKRRATDRALLAAMEREIAHEEKLRAAEAKKNPAPVISDEGAIPNRSRLWKAQLTRGGPQPIS